MFSTNSHGFTDELVGLDIAHKREMSAVVNDAQAIVDRQDRRIAVLKRQLAATRGQLATAQRSNADLILERGRARNERILQRIMKRH
jgi:hypothetical protein